MRLRRLPLRVALTAAFAAVMATVLSAAGLFVYYRTGASLDDAIRDSLRTRAATLAQEARRVPGSAVVPGERFAQVLGRDGTVLDSRPPGEAPLLTPAEARSVAGETVIDRSRPEVRLLALPVRERGALVVAGTSLEDREHALESLAGAMLVGGPLILLLACGLGYWVAGAALRPVELMRRRASEITPADRSARLPVPAGEDEIHRLATTLNDMLDRLAAAAERERSFVANASHELRTPLTVLRAELELAVRHATSVDEFRDAASEAIADADGLARLADDLLVLARADAGRLPLRPADVDLAELVREVAAETAEDPRAAGREIRAGEGEPIVVRADGDRLRQALRNMAGNAVAHGRGTIVLTARRGDDGVLLCVTDEGGPLDEATLAVAFDRFARGSAAAEAPGVGLGLAIVREVAHLHGGEARLRNAEAGVACVIELPAASASAQGSHADPGGHAALASPPATPRPA